jgi:hypothetical protein
VVRARRGRGGRRLDAVRRARRPVKRGYRSGGEGRRGRNRADTQPFASDIPYRRTPAPPQEDDIATPYDDRIDQALRTHKRQSRMVSAAIIAIGLLVVAGALLFGGSRREGRAAQLTVGDDSASVVQLMGAPPHRCEASNLTHLADQFAPGTPRPTIDEEIAQLRRGTVIRWVYPKGQGCVPDDGATEIGLDRQGRVLWVVPTRNKRPLLYEGAPT